MKKTFSVIVSLLLLCAISVCGFAAAESVRFVEDSPTFDIEMTLPEGAKVTERFDEKLISYVAIAKDGAAPVLITIAPSELYDESESFSNMKKEDIENLANDLTAADPGSTYSIDTSEEGNPYIFIHTHTGEDTYYDTLHCLYQGYFITLSQLNDDFSELTEKDTAFMLELFKNIHFIELKKSNA